MSARLRDADTRLIAAVDACTKGHIALKCAQQKILVVLDEMNNPNGSKNKAIAIKAALDAADETEQNTGSEAALDVAVSPDEETKIGLPRCASDDVPEVKNALKQAKQQGLRLA